MRPRRLKMGTRVDSGQMYHVYWNQAVAAAYSSHYFFIFLSLQFSTLKFWSHFPRELWGLKDWNLVHMWTLGKCIYGNQASAAYSSHYFFIFLSLQLSNITFFSGTVRSRRLKLGSHVDSGQLYRVYRNQAAAYLSLYFFICFSLQFSNIKIFHHTVLTNCEV